MLQNRGLGAQGIQQAKVGQAVVNCDICKAQRRAMQLAYANVRSKKAKIVWERNPENTPLKQLVYLNKPQTRRTNTLFTELTTLNLMGSQITFLKVVCQRLSWPLIWIRMVQSTHYRGKRHILMVVTPDVQAIKLWHCLYIMQPCIIYLGLQ